MNLEDRQAELRERNMRGLLDELKPLKKRREYNRLRQRRYRARLAEAVEPKRPVGRPAKAASTEIPVSVQRAKVITEAIAVYENTAAWRPDPVRIALQSAHPDG